jgi:hypothetical protein
MMLDPLSILFIIVAIGFIVLLVLLPRYGPHYSSRLTCPNCRRSFNFHWIPGATITSIVYKGRRNLKCPYCHVKSNYDIMNTRVRTPKKVSKAKAKA